MCVRMYLLHCCLLCLHLQCLNINLVQSFSCLTVTLKNLRTQRIHHTTDNTRTLVVVHGQVRAK